MLLKLLHHSTIITLSSCSGSFLYFALDDIKKRHNTRVRFEELDLKVKPDHVIKQFLNPGFFIGLLLGTSYLYRGKLANLNYY